MRSERIKVLEQSRKDDPSDPFNLYALALEYQKESIDKAAQLFDELLLNHADYLPTYYTAGSFYADQLKSNQALHLYRKGLELARKQANHAAARELQAAIQNLED